jgi:hypothetical protein
VWARSSDGATSRSPDFPVANAIRELVVMRRTP